MLYHVNHNGMKRVLAPSDQVIWSMHHMGAFWDNRIGVFVKQFINTVDFELSLILNQSYLDSSFMCMTFDSD